MTPLRRQRPLWKRDGGESSRRDQRRPGPAAGGAGIIEDVLGALRHAGPPLGGLLLQGGVVEDADDFVDVAAELFGGGAGPGGRGSESEHDEHGDGDLVYTHAPVACNAGATCATEPGSARRRRGPLWCDRGGAARARTARWRWRRGRASRPAGARATAARPDAPPAARLAARRAPHL